ncbi:hypothetical protein EDB89DRAFT_2235518 [Lactarius sanguifluus]|nr:hypothetical protein EDB89DRAFT_2235518 [Lactarius sanguifluus]
MRDLVHDPLSSHHVPSLSGSTCLLKTGGNEHNDTPTGAEQELTRRLTLTAGMRCKDASGSGPEITHFRSFQPRSGVARLSYHFGLMAFCLTRSLRSSPIPLAHPHTHTLSLSRSLPPSFYFRRPYSPCKRLASRSETGHASSRLVLPLSLNTPSPSHRPSPFEAVKTLRNRQSPWPCRPFVSGKGACARCRLPHRHRSRYLFDDPATCLCPSYLTASFPFHLVPIRVSLFISLCHPSLPSLNVWISSPLAPSLIRSLSHRPLPLPSPRSRFSTLCPSVTPAGSPPPSDSHGLGSVQRAVLPSDGLSDSELLELCLPTPSSVSPTIEPNSEDLSTAKPPFPIAAIFFEETLGPIAPALVVDETGRDFDRKLRNFRLSRHRSFGAHPARLVDAIELGRLGLTPMDIGLCMSAYGCVSAVFQLAFFPRVVVGLCVAVQLPRNTWKSLEAALGKSPSHRFLTFGDLARHAVTTQN